MIPAMAIVSAICNSLNSWCADSLLSVCSIRWPAYRPQLQSVYPALVSLKTTTNLGEGSALLSSCRTIQIKRALLLLLTNVWCVGNHHDNTNKTISKLMSFIENLI